MASPTYRATAAPSVGDNWENAANIYDGNVNSYAERYATGTSATHINGFGISLPSNAIVSSIEVHSKLYSANDDGYIVVYVCSDLKTSHSEYIAYKTVVNGASLNEQYVTQTYTAEQLIEGLNKRGIHNGNLVEFLKNLRIRFVMGDAGNKLLTLGKCRVYDNYVVVNYTIPITYTYVDYDGTVLKTQDVEEGTSPTPPSNPTRPATAEYDYTFSGWSLSGTTYTAQYTATKREYLIRVLISPEEGGEPMLREYFWEYGTETHLVVVPNPGYKFVGWDDGTFGEIIDLYPNGTGFKKNIVVTGARDYIAYFEPVYVTFDSIFNFNKWKTNGITAGNGTISDITDTGFTLTSNSGVNEGTASSPYFPVEYGKSYKIDIDITTLTPTGGSDWDIYIFFCDEDGNWIDFVDGVSNRYSEDFNNTERIFTAPNKPEVVKAQIRCDANGSSNAVSFSNFRIYPAECEYMSTTVAAEDRSNAISWDIPTPVRNGYEFIGWNTEPDGGGDAYTSASAFPPDDLTLYSQWKAVDISKIYIGAKKVTAVYIGTQKVSVYCGTKKLS